MKIKFEKVNKKPTMEAPKELSLVEIRKYMLENGCKVTNHALVKHFKRFLTNPDTQSEARKQFKTYVNILSTIKTENDQKYLILRKKYLNECPSEEMALRTDIVPNSPGAMSFVSEGLSSPFRQPPPYKPPPEVSSPLAVKLPVLQTESVDNYRECVNEFAAAVRSIDPTTRPPQQSPQEEKLPIAVDDDVKMKNSSVESEMIPKVRRENSSESENKENVVRSSVSSSETFCSIESNEKTSSDAENPISVKEATRKFNRMASEEEAKIISPPTKKKPEKVIEEKMTPEVTLSHPKGKEWVVASAKANYQELAKLASEYPELVKLQDPTTGYTALHWAAKHGNEDVVKLIAGTYKADVNARTNGGYTPLHLAMQFGREDIFALLCNVYKANRDLMDWSGNKPLDYHKQRTSVSASTYSSEYDVFMPQLSAKLNNLTAGGTIGFSRKKRSQQGRYATMSGSSLLRNQSIMASKKRKALQSMLDQDAMLKPASSPDKAANVIANNNNVVLSPELSSPQDNYYGRIPSRRKESFLRKTFRAASNKSEMVTNNNQHSE